MPLASIQPILAVERHGNADLLDVVTVLGYRAVVKRDAWKAGDLCVFIEPDSVLPDLPWAAFYKAKSSRVKAIRLRGEWSFGVVESPTAVGYAGPLTDGLDVTDALGVIKYEAPAPQELNAAGNYVFGIPKTDETRYQSLRHRHELPEDGTLVDVTLKIDGQSWSAICNLPKEGEETLAVGGRSFLYKMDAENNYIRSERKHDVLAKMKRFCSERGVNLCLRAEQYGQGIQKSAQNPHCQHAVGLAFFSTWLIDENRYARKGDPFYIFTIAEEIGLPIVPVIERDVPFSMALLKKYDEGQDLIDGKPFEGVVIQWPGGSFKVINKSYDSKK